MLKVKKLVAVNVHGYIPINLRFKPKLTFLTGSNGCGKTTALKLLSSILQPNFILLNKIQFDNIQLTCWVDEFSVDINLIKDIKSEIPNIKWEIIKKNRSKKNVNKEITPSDGEFRIYPKGNYGRHHSDEITSLKQNIKAEFLKSDFYNAINSFSSPLLLGIDRKIIGDFETSDKYRYNRRRLMNEWGDGPLDDSGFKNAQLSIMNYVSDKADKKKELIESFKSSIFKTLFKYLPYQEGSNIFSKLTESDIKGKLAITKTAINSLELGKEIIEEVEYYFDKLLEAQNNVNKTLNLKKDSKARRDSVNEYIVNRPHLERIESISKDAKKFQKEIDKLDRPLTEITEIANSFFNESNKLIRIGANGTINVDWSNKEISTRNLSSGEIQLIVIIIHLVFCENRKESTVFVIDEPELSLHISWQEKFVDALIKASPSTQFILATHSPAIISKLEYEKNCVYLKNV